MDDKRRSFLKHAAAGATLGVGAGFQPVAARAATAGRGAKGEGPEKARGLTLLSMRDRDGYSLGVKTERGVLHVRRAAAILKMPAPATVDALIAGGDQGLGELIERALAAKSAVALFVNESKVQFGPCVTNPEKIVCVGVNYARHAKEMGAPVPKQPAALSVVHPPGPIHVTNLPLGRRKNP